MFELNKSLSWIEDEKEFILINTENKKCAVMDSKGKEIWDIIKDNVNDLENVKRHFIALYPRGDKEIITHDLDEFYEMLRENSFIVEVEIGNEL